MMLTVSELYAKGLRDFAMVHDSYAVHACDVDFMQNVFFDRFVRVHTEFTLAMFADLVRRETRGVPTPDPPALGVLDLADVVKSEHFFS